MVVGLIAAPADLPELALAQHFGIVDAPERVRVRVRVRVRLRVRAA